MSTANRFRFRAWDRRFKNMVYGNPMSIFNLKNDDHIIMQSTGLLDSKGKEIFEGDIVNHYGSAGEVIFENGSFKLEWGAGIYFSSILAQEENLHSIEIIGNIYSNPELLQ